MKISECIKNLRLEKKLTQKELGDMLFVSQDTISLWERGKSNPDINAIIQMSKIFDVTTDYILCVEK